MPFLVHGHAESGGYDASRLEACYGHLPGENTTFEIYNR
jgi:hypothetical protein